MKIILEQSWNYRMFLSELFGSVFITFLTFLAFYLIIKKGSKMNELAKGVLSATIFAIIVFISIIFTKGIARIIGKQSEGLGYLNTGILFVNAFRWNAFNSLWFLALASILGSLIGMALYIGFILIMDERELDKYLFSSDMKWKKFTTKEFTFSALLFLSTIYIGKLSSDSVGGNQVFAIFVSMIAVWVIISLSSFYGFYMFAFNFSFASFIAISIYSLVKNHQLEKTQKVKLFTINNSKGPKINFLTPHENVFKKQGLYTLVQTIIHFSLAIGIGELTYILAKNNTVGFH